MTGARLRGAVGDGQVKGDHPADADVLRIGPAQTVQGAFDGLALHVEDAGLEEYVDGGFHRQTRIP